MNKYDFRGFRGVLIMDNYPLNGSGLVLTFKDNIK